MLRTCAAAVVSIALLVAPATSGVIRVDHAGGGDFTTIAEGVAAADDGDTVLVAAGVYTGPLNRGIMVGSGIVLMSEDGPEATTVDCEDEDYAFEAFSAAIDGFTIRRSAGNPEASGYLAVFLQNSTISHCVFEDNSHVGLLVYGTNTISDCSFFDHGGIAATVEPGGSTTITDCVFENSTGNALEVWNEVCGDAHPPHVIRDCVFRGNGGYGLKTLVEDPVVEECVFVENNGPAIWMQYSWAEIVDCTIVSNQSTSYGALHFTLQHHSAINDCTVQNSIIAFNSCLGVISGLPDRSDLYENCIFGNAGGDSLACEGSCYGNMFEDPLFCAMTGGDYTLCGNSPCLAENEPLGVAAGAFQDAPGCPPCNSPVESASWGTIKCLFR